MTAIDEWCQSTYARYLLSNESLLMAQFVTDIFGYRALQIGWPQLNTLAHSRINQRYLMSEQIASTQLAKNVTVIPSLLGHYSDLPFANDSMDLVILPHTLEICSEPHRLLREVDRILVPNGRVIISGFNPNSFWAWRQRSQLWLKPRLAASEQVLPFALHPLSISRLRDWMDVLDLRQRQSQMLGYRWPAQVDDAHQLTDPMQWRQGIEAMGNRWWPMLGALYVIEAVKEVRSMRLVGLIQKKRLGLARPVSISGRVPPPFQFESNESRDSDVKV